MIITLTCHAPQAPEVGYLLAKHPGSVFSRDFSAGKVWVFYPAVADDVITVALLIEIEPIGLVRGPSALAGLDQYVNDRPYVASSLMSVALRTAFTTALAGTCAKLPERVSERMRWEVTIPAVACEAGEDLITRIFAPLGYVVTTTRLPLDERFPAWGQSDIYRLQLTGEQTVQGVLSHLYVLLPVLDNTKHYYVGQDEVDKLLDHGHAWLTEHPEREVIAQRYLRYHRPLVQSALTAFAQDDPELAAVAQDGAALPAEVPTPRLHMQRLHAVLAAVREIGAHSLADLGCGEGRLLELALTERSLTRILGMDVATVALSRARRRLHLETMPEAQQERITITQGSLLYRDARLAGFDAAALVEVIEHLDEPRLWAMEQVVFGQARPRRVIITTPNRTYNAKYAALDERLRHGDHRFEWSLAEGQDWATRVAATHAYQVEQREVGDPDPTFGAPSQMLIFDRIDTTPTAAQEVEG